MPTTRGELEARITEELIRFEREFMGRGPSEARTYLLDDMVLIRLKGVITRAEHHLAQADASGRGRDLIKQTRTELLEKARPQLAAMVESILGVPLRSLHTDISVRTGERVVILVLERSPDGIA